MRAIRIILTAVLAFALLGGAAVAQGGAWLPELADGCANDDPNYFTPRITEVGPGSMVRSGCAGALELSPADRVGAGVTPWSDLQRQIDRLTLLPSGEQRQVLVVTGDSENLLLGARSTIGDYFSVGGYLAYASHGSADDDDGGVRPQSYGLGAAYEGEDWWVGFAYRRIGLDSSARPLSPEATDAFELSGQYELGSGINLRGTFGLTDPRIIGPGRSQADDGGWYIVGSVKIPF